MAITATVYPTLALRTWKGDLDFDTATCKVTLHTSSYTPNKDHQFYSSVTNEVTGTNYTAGGITLTGTAVAYDSTADQVWLDFNDPTWTNLTTTFRYAVWRVDTGSSATSQLIAWTDFGADQAPVGTDVTLVIATTGLVRVG